MPATRYAHIVLENGVPTIEGTTMKLVELVREYLSWGWGAEKLHEEHPYLSLGAIHSALAYYWDNREEVDADIARRDRLVDEYRAMHPDSEAILRLRERAKRR